jgi:hypothetical protein
MSNTDGVHEEELEAARAPNRFDIRIIGFLFALYGAALVIVGLVGSSEV